MNRPSINNLQELLDNENYNNFHNQKKQIQAKYDERLLHWLSPTTKQPKHLKQWYIEEGYKQWREYLKEMGDLMLKPDSDYQKFVWDIVPVHIQRKMEEEYGDI
jgi:hypothetical protein